MRYFYKNPSSCGYCSHCKRKNFLLGEQKCSEHNIDLASEILYISACKSFNAKPKSKQEIIKEKINFGKASAPPRPKIKR